MPTHIQTKLWPLDFTSAGVAQMLSLHKKESADFFGIGRRSFTARNGWAQMHFSDSLLA
jgi:hypothetical protein